MKANLLVLTAALLVSACRAHDDNDAPETLHEGDAALTVSAAAIDLERAERLLDRGADASRALDLATEALASKTLTDAERVRGLVVQSRARDELGDREGAVTILESALAEFVTNQPGGLWRTNSGAC